MRLNAACRAGFGSSRSSASGSSPATITPSRRSWFSRIWALNAVAIRSAWRWASSRFASRVIAVTTPMPAAVSNRKAQPSVATVLANMRAEEPAFVLFAAKG